MKRIDALFENAKEFYINGDAAHDPAHIVRVMDNAKWLVQREGGELEIVLAAAILHDIVNLPKNHPERLQASQMAAVKSKELLSQSGYLNDEILKISNVIVEHSYSLGKKPTSKESMILQDADKLDALGAVGIMRTVTCGAKMGAGYYEFNDPWAMNRDLDDKAFTLDHFFVKLFKLPELMNTNSALLEANRRVEFMKSFLDQLNLEITPI